MRYDFERLAAAGGVRRRPGLLGRLLSAVVAAVLLGLALMFSLVVFAVLAVVGLLVGVWFWWKTRALRRQMASMAEEARRNGPEREAGAGPAEGVVIEGEVIRVSDTTGELPRRPDVP